jgi:hypothetical protein
MEHLKQRNRSVTIVGSLLAPTRKPRIVVFIFSFSGSVRSLQEKLLGKFPRSTRLALSKGS